MPRIDFSIVRLFLQTLVPLPQHHKLSLHQFINYSILPIERFAGYCDRMLISGHFHSVMDFVFYTFLQFFFSPGYYYYYLCAYVRNNKPGGGFINIITSFHPSRSPFCKQIYKVTMFIYNNSNLNLPFLSLSINLFRTGYRQNLFCPCSTHSPL